jgi:hypothetical protein
MPAIRSTCRARRCPSNQSPVRSSVGFDRRTPPLAFAYAMVTINFPCYADTIEAPFPNARHLDRKDRRRPRNALAD